GRVGGYNPWGWSCLNLVLRVALAACADRVCVAHAPAGWGSRTCDKSDHWLVAAGVRKKGCGFLLGAAADLADHDDGLGRVVLEEQRKRIDEARAVHRIATDANDRGLAEASGGRLGPRLVAPPGPT